MLHSFGSKLSWNKLTETLADRLSASTTATDLSDTPRISKSVGFGIVEQTQFLSDEKSAESESQPVMTDLAKPEDPIGSTEKNPSSDEQTGNSMQVLSDMLVEIEVKHSATITKRLSK